MKWETYAAIVTIYWKMHGVCYWSTDRVRVRFRELSSLTRIGDACPLLSSLVTPPLLRCFKCRQKALCSEKELSGVQNAVNKNAQRWVALYSTCLPLTNLYGKHDLTAFFTLKVFCVWIPCNESWLKWVRNSRLIMLLARPHRTVVFSLLRKKLSHMLAVPETWLSPCWATLPGHVLPRALMALGAAFPWHVCVCGDVWLSQNLAMHV